MQEALMIPKKLEPTDYLELDSSMIVQWCWAKELLLDVIETRKNMTEDKYKELANVMRKHLTTRTLEEIEAWCEDNATRVEQAVDDNIQMVEIDQLLSFLRGSHDSKA